MSTPLYPNDPPGRPIEIFGSQVKYWVYHEDKTPTILVIHGYRGTHHGLIDVIDQLPDYRFIVPDLPGFGESTPMTSQPHDLIGYARFIQSLAHELGLNQSILLGHSMGTSVAAELIVLDPELFSKLILINPIAQPPLTGIGKFKLAPGFWYEWLGGRLLPAPIGNRILRDRWLILIASVNMVKTRDKALRQRIHATHTQYMVRFSNRNTLLEAYDSSLKGNVTTHAAKIKLPTLLIAGANDDIAPIKGQRKLAEALPQAQLVELDNVGHLIHYEKPREAAEAINGFLRPTGSVSA